MPEALAEVWALTTLFTVLFAWKEAVVMPPAVAVAVWAIS
jgi:hypothetical protein